MSKNISKKIAELIADAPVRKKAAIYISNWEEKNSLKQKPLITEEEAKDIVRSLKNDDERREFNKYINFYDVFVRLSPMFGLCEAQYKGNANQATGYLRQIEAYLQEENHLNAMYLDLQEIGNKEAIEAFKKRLRSLDFQWAKVKICEDDYIEIDATKLWELAKSEIKHTYLSFQYYKSLIMVTEEFIKKKKAAPFLPQVMKESIASAKDDYALEVAPRYSRKALKERIDRGEQVTKREQERAIFPYYEEVETPEDMIEMWRKRIANIERYG